MYKKTSVMELNLRMKIAATQTVNQSGLSRELSVDSIVSKLSWSCSLYGRTAKRRRTDIFNLSNLRCVQCQLLISEEA